jgi:superfamily I DNA/RNA helicase
MNALPCISSEQKQVVEVIENGSNVIVNSVAGSGKTTTILHIASHFPEKNILLLTYNAKLKFETRTKVVKMNLENIEVHSYHSFCVRHYDENCLNDGVIKDIIRKNKQSKQPFAYDLIILDEAQDINPMYYQLICKIYKSNVNDNKNKKKKEVNICMLGDEKQSIFDFNQADERFLTLADQIFTLNSLPWERRTLSQSFRMTDKMADFINYCMMDAPRIMSNKKCITTPTLTNAETHKPRYLKCNPFGPRIYNEVKKYLDMGYNSWDIFILAATLKSVNKFSPVRELENAIKSDKGRNIPVYVPTGDDTKLDSDVLDGKLAFSTFHQAKGLERKIVIVFSFDKSYFDYIKKNADPTICPNEMYVAATRALEHLIIIHDYKNDHLPFLSDETALRKYCDYVCDSYPLKKKSPEQFPEKSQKMSPTELTKHITQDLLDNCCDYFDIIPIQNKKEMITIPLKTKQQYGDGLEGSESVSELTGIAIPAYYQYYYHDKNATRVLDILERIIDFEKDNPEKKNLRDVPFSKKEFKSLTPAKLLYIANAWATIKSGYLFKFKQIADYDWLTEENLQQCADRLKKLNISESAIFEKEYILHGTKNNYKELGKKTMTGYVDCIDGNRIFEFKCVQNLDKDHFLQLAQYMYMDKIDKKNEEKKRKEEIAEEKETRKEKRTRDGEWKKEEEEEDEEGEEMELETELEETDDGELNTEIHRRKQLNKEIRHYRANVCRYYLYNILTDEMFEIKSEMSKLREMMKVLVHGKYAIKTKLTNAQFLASLPPHV